MSRMLLSIKPEYVNKIISGKKKYEFRKFHCREGIDTIVIYATAPMKKATLSTYGTRQKASAAS